MHISKIYELIYIYIVGIQASSYFLEIEYIHIIYVRSQVLNVEF